MAGDSHIREQALREVVRNYPFRIRCKILKYQPHQEGGPSVLACSYTALQAVDSYPNEDEFWEENVYEFVPHFPEGVVFDLDPDKYDVYVDPPMGYSKHCFPVANAIWREQSTMVPYGYTPDEVIDRAVDPDSVQMRIIRSKQRIESYKECNPGEEPMWARQHDVWFGAIRHSMDQQMFDIWSAPNRYIARFHHKAITFLNEQFKNPMSDGIETVWRDKIEHPFQRQFGSSAVVNYPRFMSTLGVDPGYIIGVILELRRFFRSLDREESGVTVENYKSYEVIDYMDDVPEV